MKNHLWQGQWLDDNEFAVKLETLSEAVAETLIHPLNLENLIETSHKFSQRLLHDEVLQNRLSLEIQSSGEVTKGEDINSIFREIADFLSSESLRQKVSRELGSTSPFEVRRIRHDRAIFESWAPLGFLVHIAPGNVFSVAILSAIEGLLTGNFNAVKVAGDASLFSHIFFDEFFKSDVTGQLKDFLILSRFSSSKREWLKALANQSDGLAAWGNEETVKSLKEILPSTSRLIAWGHRLSMIYIAQERIEETEIVTSIAQEICLLDQQACSSPQCVYLETKSAEQLNQFARKLAGRLAEVSPQIPRGQPDRAEASEITMITEKQRINKALGHGDFIVDPQGQWRILVDYRSELQPSPLFRTIWLKPLPSEEIVRTLRPLRGYLQTVGLIAPVNRFPHLSQAFQVAGALRMRPIGRMLESYPGEPHDGEYALTRYTRRMTFEGDQQFKGLSSFSQIDPAKTVAPERTPIQGKVDFQSQKVSEQSSDLFFKSGGSSGAPKISIFTYEDYHRQMACAAEGLYAAGLDPANDRCMNLFFGGGLYGGFLSFFTILERLRAKQFPMAAHFEWPFVIDTIIKNRVNVLLGMPSYLLQLFEQGGDRLREAGVVKKVFYGGEHFTRAQRQLLTEIFGVELIKSATYGSVDAGPLGYQCEHCEGSVHHLHHELQSLEIVKLEEDFPVFPGEIGRLIFSSKVRTGQASLVRYEIGDVGRWIPEECACGRLGPRFELLGRHGDVFRSGGEYLNYRKLEKALSENLSYAGEMQIEISNSDGRDELLIRVHESIAANSEKIISALVTEDQDLHGVVEKEKSLRLKVRHSKSEDFLRTPGSGKLMRIVDRRMR